MLWLVVDWGRLDLLIMVLHQYWDLLLHDDRLLLDDWDDLVDGFRDRNWDVLVDWVEVRLRDLCVCACVNKVTVSIGAFWGGTVIVSGSLSLIWIFIGSTHLAAAERIAHALGMRNARRLPNDTLRQLAAGWLAGWLLITYLDHDWVWNWLGNWHNLWYMDDVRFRNLDHVGLRHWLGNWHWLSHWNVLQDWVWSVYVLDDRNNHMLRYKFRNWQLLKYWIWL